MDETAFIMCNQALPKIMLYGDGSSTTLNNTNIVVGPATTSSMISPSETVLEPLNTMRTLPRDWRLEVLYPICRKADKCKRSAELLESIKILHTMCLSMLRVKTRASSCGVDKWISSVGLNTNGLSIGCALSGMNVYWMWSTYVKVQVAWILFLT